MQRGSSARVPRIDEPIDSGEVWWSQWRHTWLDMLAGRLTSSRDALASVRRGRLAAAQEEMLKRRIDTSVKAQSAQK